MFSAQRNVLPQKVFNNAGEDEGHELRLIHQLEKVEKFWSKIDVINQGHASQKEMMMLCCLYIQKSIFLDIICICLPNLLNILFQKSFCFTFKFRYITQLLSE